MWGSRAIFAVVALVLSSTASADDPNEKLSPQELALDRATVRRLNNEQLASVRQRDARYAMGWRAYDSQHGSSSKQVKYAQAQRQYEADLARWRRDVAACRAGDYSRCAR